LIAFPMPSAPFHEVELTEFEPPTRIRWAERSKNSSRRRRVATTSRPKAAPSSPIHNVLEGHGLGKLLEPLALRSTHLD
jgi:hypothetical protein